MQTKGGAMSETICWKVYRTDNGDVRGISEDVLNGRAWEVGWKALPNERYPEGTTGVILSLLDPEYSPDRKVVQIKIDGPGVQKTEWRTPDEIE